MIYVMMALYQEAHGLQSGDVYECHKIDRKSVV